MDIFSLFTLCGGLAFFLFGMHVMSQSLEKIAGGKLETALKKMTSNPLKSLALGAGITVAVQSSSALTVMLVGLVNSGIMELEQTVGVIMGSNIGTTLTAWLLSLSGIESDSFWLSLLKPENFSPVVALVGVILLMGSKKKKKQDIGTILVGFSVLMYGMELMKNAVSPLTEMEEFKQLLVAFNNPVLSVLFGAVFTGVIQSSAASVGILQAFSISGSITYRMAIPIIMGQNIGTCVTALLSSIGVTKNAKRVTVVHMAFNMIGTIFFLIAFYLLNAIFSFSFTDKAISPAEIAMVHSVFNIATTLVLLPFTGQLVKLANTVIPPTNEQEQKVMLDERLLSSPPLAVSQCREKTADMAKIAKSAILEALQSIFHYSSETKQSVEKKEQELDFMEDALATFMIQLSSKDLTEADNNTISELLHLISDFERIGDHAINIVEIAEEMQKNEQVFSDTARADFITLSAAIAEITEITMKAFIHGNLTEALRVEPLEEVIDNLTVTIRSKHIERLKRAECSPELGIPLSDLLINCERVSDHCSNIAVAMIEISQSKLDVHDYLDTLKAERTPEFIENFNHFNRKYRLT